MRSVESTLVPITKIFTGRVRAGILRLPVREIPPLPKIEASEALNFRCINGVLLSDIASIAPPVAESSPTPARQRINQLARRLRGGAAFWGALAIPVAGGFANGWPGLAMPLGVGRAIGCRKDFGG